MRPIFETLREIRRGDALDELGVELNALVAAVRATGKPGSLTLTLKVKPASAGDITTLMITDLIAAKAPRGERESTVFFSDANNDLLRRDPRQAEIPLRGIPEAPAEPARDLQWGRDHGN